MFYRIVTILSLLLATGLGFLIFGSQREAPVALHALFLLLVAGFLLGLLHEIRSQIENWVDAHPKHRESDRTE